MTTIFALATPPGRGGVAVIRISGPRAGEALAALSGKQAPAARRAVLRVLTNPETGGVIDHALVLFFAAPHSFTGEDVAELHLHGGRAVVDGALRALAPFGRLAEPGEFTRRAFENGRMDLTAAEAVADLIDAETEAQAAQALEQMGGALAALYDGWRARLTRALAHLEADIDFPDEDLPDGVAGEVRPDLQALRDEMRAHLDDNRRGERLRDGIHIAVIGAPNAGKSSLVNALSRREVAIVSEHAGTTRDVVEAHLNLGGYPVILADTAGLRPEQVTDDAHGQIEGEGIRRARARAKDADITLLVFDASAPPDAATLGLRDGRSVIVRNKSDLAPGQHALGEGAVLFSARTADNLAGLTGAIVAKIKAVLGERHAPPLTRQRHRAALEDAAAALNRALAGRETELIAEDARLAIRALGRITGRVDVEDLLDVIFRDFCIGK